MFETVSVHDEAIDHDKTTPAMLREFAETRDLSKLVFRADVKPTRYALDYVKHAMLSNWLMDNNVTETEQAFRAFAHSVQRWTNHLQVDGTRVDYTPPRNKAGSIEAEVLERIPGVVLAEIGGVALRRSFFGPTIKHGYALPPLSAALLVEQIGRRAASSPSSPVPSSEPVSST